MRHLAALLLLLEVLICPMDAQEIYESGQIVKEHYQGIMIEGRQVSDGRQFLKGFDLHLSKWCLYVVNPDGLVERYEYKEQTK
ncbi:hypothetical protein [Candidatus Magnetobacterium casense]|uniref:Secreted protein n=1 Tax=Candidatus Magnetobacterium casense TaxID=1455061 RepID=A0ABS6S0K0_9BACT|nr:hypothetical protein [Candidatus Magnetobacterium casensis]MBV6342374.1 hypothetical protein [Candidatus Magnetobacterium casensis]